jgi:hypothetical protein
MFIPDPGAKKEYASMHRMIVTSVIATKNPIMEILLNIIH